MLLVNWLPLLVGRVSGLSPEAMEAMCLPATAATVDRALQWESTMDHLGGRLVQELHQLVPRLDDSRELRRIVLRLKRDVYAGREPTISLATMAEIRDALGDAGHLLDAWCSAAEQRKSERWDAARSIGYETGHANRHLRDAMQTPTVTKALALAGEDFLRFCADKAAVGYWGAQTRLGRTGMSYLARAATKTSPFSTFTGLVFASQPAESVSITTIRRAVPLVMLQAFARDAELASALKFQRGEPFSNATGGLTYLVPSLTIAHGRVARQERKLRVPATHPLAAALRGFSQGTLAELLEGLPHNAGHPAVRQCLDYGLVYPVAPWSHVEVNPVQKLAEALQVVPSQRARCLAEELKRVAQLCQEFGPLDGLARLKATDEIRSSVSRILGEVNAEVPDWLGRFNLVYEDVRAAGQPPSLGPHVAEDLNRIAAREHKRFRISSAYRLMCREFVRQFGMAGTCTDILSFLCSFFERPERLAMMQRAIEEERVALDSIEPQAWANVGPSAARPSMSIFYQIAARSCADLENGNYTLVVNRFGTGNGGLLARYAPLLPGPSGLNDQLSAWIKHLFPTARVLSFPVMADSNNLQVGAPLALETLAWGTETPGVEKEPVNRLAELRLRYDDALQSLLLVDSGNVPVAPVYLGGIPDYLMAGPVHLLLLLANPWVHVGAFARAMAPWVHPDAVVAIPRHQTGRIVFQRAAWLVPVRQFPRWQKGESELDYLFRLRRWRKTHDMPDEVYAFTVNAVNTVFQRKTKPLWLSFSSLHAAETVKGITNHDDATLVLEEALPGREQHWYRGTDGTLRASEFLALVSWPEQPD